jgi:hypothetical protein
LKPLKFLETKFWSSAAWAALRDFFIFKILFFLGTNEPDFSQAFREHQARSIPTSYQPVVNFCSKHLENVIFFASHGALSLRTHGSNFEVGRGWVALDLPKIKFILPVHHRILVLFKFFFPPWFYMMCSSMQPIGS